VAITGLGMLERSGMLVAVVFISWLIYHSILSGELEVAASRRSRC
jgi:hypothetical protein